MDWLKRFLEWLWSLFSGGEVKEKTGWEGLIQAIRDSSMHDSQKVGAMAQAIIESARGTSALAQEHNNFFGMKWRKELEGLATPVQYQAHDGVDTYCKFQSPAKCVEGYQAFIKRSPYAGWQGHLSSPLTYVSFLKACGYAEDPKYVEKLSKLFPEAETLLEGEPERPTNTSEEFQVQIVPVKGVKFKNIGRYKTSTQKAIGCVVHFTAGRFDEGKQSAINTLKWLVSEGLGCMVMDTNGIIYVAENYSLDYYNYHAGTSTWKGKSSLSSLLEGMEICNAGKLDSSGKAWFGQQIPQDKIRTVKAEANRQGGLYHSYTEAQEKALKAFLRLRLKEVPGYSIDWIVGHDEIAPGRKNDPGGSLSVTMPELRKQL